MPKGDFSFICTKEDYMLVRCDQCQKLMRIPIKNINTVTGEIYNNGINCRGCQTLNTFIVGIDLTTGMVSSCISSENWNNLTYEEESHSPAMVSPYQPYATDMSEGQTFRIVVEDPNAARCPRCGSTSITADKKGYGYIKGGIGALIAGPIGLLAGGIGSKKIENHCLNCGYDWTPN